MSSLSPTPTSPTIGSPEFSEQSHLLKSTATKELYSYHRQKAKVFRKKMMCCIMFALVIFASVVASIVSKGREQDKFNKNDKRSFGELAADSVVPAYSKVLLSLPYVNSDSKPDTPTFHTARKDLLQLRNSIDIYAAAYFPVDTVDVWREIRNDIAHGYRIFGDLQDLKHSNVAYTPEVATSRLQTCLDWKTNFEANMITLHAKHYLAKPSLHKIYVNKSRHQSDFFWGDIKLQPQANMTGIQNVCSMISQLCDNFGVHAAEVKRFDDIFPVKRHEKFHNLRKMSRGIINIHKILPQAFKYDAEPLVTFLGQFYKRMGKVNDAWTQYNFYNTADSDSIDSEASVDAVANAKNITAAGWAEMKEFMIKIDIDQVVKDISDNLIA